MMRHRLEGSELEEYVSSVTKALVRELSPERIILFGSFARGDQNRTSDFDVVVITPTTLAFCDRIGQALKACYAASSRLPVEALVYTPAEWERMVSDGNSFARLVLQEGQVLYDRGSEPDRGATLAQAGTS